MKIEDNQSLKLVRNEYGHIIPHHDDGYGPVWVYHESLGNYSFPFAVVRARNEWEAWEIVQDEFLTECDKTVDELEKDYGPEWSEDLCFLENYVLRPNGPNNTDVMGHGIAQLDPNGLSLRRLSEKDELELEISTEE